MYDLRFFDLGFEGFENWCFEFAVFLSMEEILI